MPLGASIVLSGSVGSLDLPSSILAAFAGQEAHFEGLVSTLLADSEDGPSTLYGLEIWLGDHRVPSEAIRGPFEIEESLDTPAVSFGFTLAGNRYGVLSTTTTWARTPVEVWATVARPGGPLRTFLRAAGYVLGGEQTGGFEPLVRVTCGDPSVLFDRVELCHEVPPGASQRRGAILADLCGSAGIGATDFPEGAVFSKAVQTDSRRLFEYMGGFAEPEGWSFRFRAADGVLEAYDAVLVEEPLPPDQVWTSSDFLSLRTSPPSDVPSRAVMRGSRVVLLNEQGVKTTVTRTEVKALYAKKVAVSIQHTDGTIAATGLEQAAETLMPVSLIEGEVQEAGGRTVRHVTREWGWFNPAAAQLRTVDGSEPAGPVEEGFYYAEAYVDDAGNFLAWPEERWVLKGERRETPEYEGDTVVSVTTDVLRWFRRTMGVRQVGSEEAHVIGAGVGSDGQSYRVVNPIPSPVRVLEEFGLAESHTVRYTYGIAGAAEKEVQEAHGFRSPRVAIEGNPYWIRYDGTGQKDLIAQYGITERRTVTNLVKDGLLAGKVQLLESLHAPKKVAGAFDWGDFRSNAGEERFGPTRTERVTYNVLSENRYEEIVEDERGRQVPKVVEGRAPSPRYRSSPWTSLAQQPIETAIDDPVLADWFGFQTEVLNQEFIQTLEEARAVLLRRRRRRLAFVHEVTAPRRSVRPGDTVLLIDPGLDVHHRCLLTKVRETWALAPQTQVLGTYTLEQPL